MVLYPSRANPAYVPQESSEDLGIKPEAEHYASDQLYIPRRFTSSNRHSLRELEHALMAWACSLRLRMPSYLALPAPTNQRCARAILSDVEVLHREFATHLPLCVNAVPLYDSQTFQYEVRIF